MLFHEFYNCLADRPRTQRIEVETLRDIVNLHHTGVGRVTFKYFDDFPGAQFGSFVWLAGEQTSAYEESYNDAVVFINGLYHEDRPMRRTIGAKELMHVFDTAEQRTNDPGKYRTLLKEIASSPVSEDMSEQYSADRGALWKAIIALVPHWVREDFKAQWDRGEVKAPELEARLWLPESIVAAAMGDYYDTMFARLITDPQAKADRVKPAANG